MPLTEFMRVVQYDTLFRNVSFTFNHTNAYVGLFTADPGHAGDQSNEVSGGSYTRVQPTWDPVTSDSESITSAIDFPTATASWGTVTYVGLLDAATGGTMLAYEVLGTPIDVDIDDLVRLDTGSLTATVTFDGGFLRGEDTVFQEYRQTVLLEAVLHGGTLGPHKSWAGLLTTSSVSGAPGGFFAGVDPGLADGYEHIQVQWEIVSNNPLTIRNVNALIWTCQNVNVAADGWRLANRAVMLVDDEVPNMNNDGAPGARGWMRVNGPTFDFMTPLDVLSVKAGAWVVTF